MLATQAVIDALAGRIERAYRLRRVGWHGASTSSRVWTAAASVLLAARASDPLLPLDPALFVAAQPADEMYPDPWGELTQPSAVENYRRRVRAIVRRLRAELSAEVRYAEDRISAGGSVARVLSSNSRRLSPLGRYVVAQRAGRPALAGRYRHDAAVQHESCPLYRQACKEILPASAYPVPDVETLAVTPKAFKGLASSQVPLK